MENRLGGQLAHRPLHFFYIADCSGSMASNGKIQSLNMAIRETIPQMRVAASENPQAQVLVRSLTFSAGAQWHVPLPTPVDQFNWTDLEADGQTDMGKALLMLADQLRIPPMESRALPPVLVLLSDGQPTDDFGSGLKALDEQPWGVKAVRVAIAIGADADLDVLQRFLRNPERKPLITENAEQLVSHIRWASTAVLSAAAKPPSQAIGVAGTSVNVPIPAAPAGGLTGASEPW